MYQGLRAHPPRVHSSSPSPPVDVGVVMLLCLGCLSSKQNLMSLGRLVGP
jgi:hypothetical protein